MTANKLNQGVAGLSLRIDTPAQTNMLLNDKPAMANGMFMQLPVAEIEFFDKNPRRQHDEASYAAIKESIRATGIQQPVHVTQRPGENHYVLAQGGNTRLKIMRELYQETGESRFRNIPCFYVAYTNETELQIAHLIENEQRAEMCFWDKACAYAEVRDIFQDESNERLSLRELEVMFGTAGLVVSHKTLNLFFFASDSLQELSRYAYELSNAKVAEIKKLHTAMAVAAKKAGEADGFLATWSDILEQWHEQYTADTLDVTALLDFVSDRFKTVYGTAAFIDENETGSNDTQYSESGSNFLKNHPSSAKLNAEEIGAVQLQAAPATEGGTLVSNKTVPVSFTPTGASQPEVDPPAGTAHAVEAETVEQITKNLHTAVKKWLNRVGLAECFKSNPAFPLGFYIEYPDFSAIANNPEAISPFIVDNLHTEAGNVFTYLWKLCGLDELMLNIDDADNPILALPDDSKVRIAYHDPDKWDEFLNFGIGDRPTLVNCVLHWQTHANHPFCPVLEEIHLLVRQINAQGEA